MTHRSIIPRVHFLNGFMLKPFNETTALPWNKWMGHFLGPLVQRTPEDSRGLDTRPLNQPRLFACVTCDVPTICPPLASLTIIPWERGGALINCPMQQTTAAWSDVWHLGWPKKPPGKLPATKGFHIKMELSPSSLDDWFHRKIPKKPWITGGTPIRKPPTTGPRTGEGSQVLPTEKSWFVNTNYKYM